MHVVVDDLDAHYARSVAGGAVIRSEPAARGPVRVYVASDCGDQQWIFAEPV